MEKYYRFANVELAVEIPAEQMYSEERHLGHFQVETVADPHVFRFEVSDSLTPPAGVRIANEAGFRVYREGEWMVRYLGSVAQGWENAYMRIAFCGKQHRVQIRSSMAANRVGTQMVLNAIGAEHLIAQAGGFVFHCSYIERNGKGILFTAPSGTGKSTQADLWQKYRGTRIINGDRAVIRMDHGQILAEGIPFAGSSAYCENRSLPLAAIVYLEQAPHTSIRAMRGYEAFSRIWEGVTVNTWDREDLEKVSEVVSQTAQRVPVFHLACTPDESAVIALERML